VDASTRAIGNILGDFAVLLHPSGKFHTSLSHVFSDISISKTGQKLPRRPVGV
jgi:hypothetical protein